LSAHTWATEMNNKPYIVINIDVWNLGKEILTVTIVAEGYRRNWTIKKTVTRSKMGVSRVKRPVIMPQTQCSPIEC